MKRFVLNFGTILLALVAITCVLAFTGCAGITSAITGQPIHATPVKKEGGKPFNVASSDIARAEVAPPETVWGLYDAGMVARRATEVLETGK